ncbi:MAG: manganese efflux pump MntP family protein [Clostridiales bacterium]|nr:manganese efflux pump MntP family protein [Clostridiales bacterium]
MGIVFFLQSLGLGAGLAMDACAVSVSNGLSEPKMRAVKAFCIALTFAVFQALMPLIGYFAGHVFVRFIGKFIPWIALGVLTILGIKMIVDGVKENKRAAAGQEEEHKPLTVGALFMQAIATSIDALGVGITFAAYRVVQAVVAAVLIAVVTLAICFPAVYIGKKFGKSLGGKSVIVGGCILIAIGIEICITGLL